MQILVLATASQKEELIPGISNGQARITWLQTVDELTGHPGADAVIDLLFEHSPERISALSQFSQMVFINSVVYTLQQTSDLFIRINGWDTLLSGPIIEAAVLDESRKKKAEEILSGFGKNVQWLPDQPGFMTPRVISMIINEAFLALEEGVSTEEEINTAMRLGTNYPFGPFEWASKIGVQKIYSLLHVLSAQNKRYYPSSLLKQAEESC